MKIGQRQVNPDRVSSGVMVVLMAYVFYYANTAHWAHILTRDGLSVGFFPRLAAAATFIMAALVLVFPGKTYPKALKEFSLKGMLTSLVGMVGTVAFFIILMRYGYLVAAFPFLAGGMFYLGVRPWYRSLINALISTIIVYAVFTFLGFPLPGIGN